eukprot:Opistho-2@96971
MSEDAFAKKPHDVARSQKFFRAFLAIGMLATGTCNTIMTKLQDRISTPTGVNGTEEVFDHPYFQTYTMFIGEFLCIFAYIISFKYQMRQSLRGYSAINGEAPPPPPKKSNHPWWVFIIPTCCDLTATTLMNVGLTYTSTSVYQMLRGAMVFFTALFSIIFLRRRLHFQHWFGLVWIVAGIAIVGAASVIFGEEDSHSKNPVLGNVLVIAAQVIVATQFVVEEKLLSKYEVPSLCAVGNEGFWGVVILTCVLPILQVIHVNSHPVEDSLNALDQMGDSWKLNVAIFGSVISIAFFNYFGISVTKFLSATHRCTIDSCRTLFIWAITLLLGWEKFIWLQLIGFAVLVFGTFSYNHVFVIPRRWIDKLSFKLTFLPAVCWEVEGETEHHSLSEETQPLVSTETVEVGK